MKTTAIDLVKEEREKQIPNIKTKTNALESLNIEITDADLPF